MSKKIWLVRDPGKEVDLTRAHSHGELMKPVFDSRVSPYDLHRQEEIIRTEVVPFSSAADCILTVGPQVMVATLAALWMEEHGCVRFLLWNRWRDCYIERYIGKNGA